MSDDSVRPPTPWPVERAGTYWRARPWPVGCNFIPSTAVNQLEMWQAETHDPETIDRELAWASSLGFNTVRVYLHDLVWQHDRDGLLERVDGLLVTAMRHGIRVMPVFFDDVWDTDPRPGPQPEPHPGRHNSRWVQSPGLPALLRYAADSGLRARLEDYVCGVMSAFASRDEILAWDLYNEPGGFPSPGSEPVGNACLPLLRDVFRWAREAGATQPLTSGLWSNPLRENDPRIEAWQLAASDVVSFHHYGPADDLRRLLADLSSRTDRPLVCTEYLARNLGCDFGSHLPIFRESVVGAINWGLVSGRTQTIYPWWSWFDAEPQPEPEVWFHDVFRPDGTPHDAEEAAFVRGILQTQSSET